VLGVFGGGVPKLGWVLFKGIILLLIFA